MNPSLTLEDAAKLLGIAPKKLRKLCDLGLCPAIRWGGTGPYAFDADLLDAWRKQEIARDTAVRRERSGV